MESPSPSPTPTNTDGTSTDGRTTVSDSSVVSGLYINLILGVLLTLGFCITQTWSRELYRFRTFSESVTLPPPNISMKGRWAKYIRWAKVTWHVTDIDILVSCGLDAFVMHKLPMLGIQYFIPMAFLSMFVLVPLSLTNNWLQDEQNEVNSGRLAWLTISAIAPDSPLLWVHFSLLYVYVLYGLGLLYHHFVQFARLRLLYIRRGDDLSFYAEVLAQKMRQEQAKVAQLQAAANSVDKGAVPSKAAQQQWQQQQQALSAAQANVVRLQRRQEFLLHVMEGARARVSHLADLRDDQHGPPLSALDTFVGGTTGVNMRRRQEPLMYFGPRMLWRDYTLKKYKMDAKAAAKPAAEDAAGAVAHPNKRGPFAKLQFWRSKLTAAEREPVGRASQTSAPGAAAAAGSLAGDAAAPSHVVQMEQAAARMYPAPAPQQAMERGAPVAGNRSSTQPAKRVTHAPEPVAEGLEAPGRGTGAGVQGLTPDPGPKKELSVPKFLALDDMMKELGNLVSGTGRLGSATPQLQKLQDSAPLTFLERPSARYTSSILTRADVSTWQASKDTPDFTFALAPPLDSSHGGARGPRIGQLLRRRRGPGGSRPAAPDPELELDNQHKWDDLPWGDINHTGEPHLQAVQIHRYAVLVTDVPVPPFPASAGMGEDVQEQARERSDIPAWLDSSSWISGEAAQYAHANQLLRWLYEKVAMVLFPSFGSPVELMHELTLAGPSEQEELAQDPREARGLWGSKLEPGAVEDDNQDLQASSTHDEQQNRSGRPPVPADAQPTAVGEVEIVASAARGDGAAAAVGGSAAGVGQAGVGMSPNVPAAGQATGMGPGAAGRAGGDSHVIHVRPPANSPSLQRGPSARRPSASSHGSAPDGGHVLQVGASKLLKLPSVRRPAHTATSTHPTATTTGVPAAVPPAATTSLRGIQEGDAHASLRPRDGQLSTIPSAPHPSDLTAPAAPGVGPLASRPAEAVGSPASDPKGAMGVTRERVQQLWAVAREGVLSGRVAALPRSTRYDPVSALFSELFPHEFDRAIPIMDYSKLHIMLRFWNKHMIGLDSALEVLEQQQRRPWHLPCPAGCLRLHPVDTIDYLTEMVGRCQRDIMAERMRVTSGQGRGTGCYVVLFKSQASAALAASNATALTRNTGQFMVHPAPCPSNVNWHTLLIPWATRRWMTFAMLLPKIIVVLFPVAAFSSAFMQLDYIFCPVNATTPEAEAKVQLTWPWYCDQETWFSQIFKKFIVGWCPSLLLSLYSSMVVPNAFHGLVQASFNHLSLSDADREVCLLYVLYDAFNVLLCGVLGATFVQQMNRAIFTEGLHAFFTLLGTQLPQSSNFFINYLSHKALVSFCNKLIIPHGGVTMFLFKRYLRVFRVFSIREQMFKLYTCRSPRYGPEIGNLMLAFVVGSAFAIVSPLVPLMAVVFFLLGYFVWKYLLLYIFVRKYETGGSFFHFIFECLLGCLAIMVIFTGAVIAAKGGVTQFWIIMITLPWLILYAGWYARYTFGPMLGGKLPLEVAAQAPRAHVDPRLFTHPALHPHALGWHPDLHLVWGGLCIWGAQ